MLSKATGLLLAVSGAWKELSPAKKAISAALGILVIGVGGGMSLAKWMETPELVAENRAAVQILAPAVDSLRIARDEHRRLFRAIQETQQEMNGTLNDLTVIQCMMLAEESGESAAQVCGARLQGLGGR